MQNLNTIGSRIKLARERKKLSVEDILKKMPPTKNGKQIDPAQFSRWEKDEQTPRDGTLRALAEILEVGFGWLRVGDTGAAPGASRNAGPATAAAESGGKELPPYDEHTLGAVAISLESMRFVEHFTKAFDLKLTVGGITVMVSITSQRLAAHQARTISDIPTDAIADLTRTLLDAVRAGEIR